MPMPRRDLTGYDPTDPTERSLRTAYNAHGDRTDAARDAASKYQAWKRQNKTSSGAGGDDQLSGSAAATPSSEEQTTTAAPASTVDESHAVAPLEPDREGAAPPAAPSRPIPARVLHVGSNGPAVQPPALLETAAPKPAPAQLVGKVTARGASRRIQGLLFMGYTPEDIARATKGTVSLNSVWVLAFQPPTHVQDITHRVIVREFLRLRTEVCDPSNGNVQWARALATEYGFAGPYAWGDIDHDDEPEFTGKPNASTRKMVADVHSTMPEAVAPVDDVPDIAALQRRLAEATAKHAEYEAELDSLTGKVTEERRGRLTAERNAEAAEDARIVASARASELEEQLELADEQIRLTDTAALAAGVPLDSTGRAFQLAHGLEVEETPDALRLVVPRLGSTPFAVKLAVPVGALGGRDDVAIYLQERAS